MFGSLCKQTDNLTTDYNTLYYSEQKLKQISSILKQSKFKKQAKRNMHR